MSGGVTGQDTEGRSPTTLSACLLTVEKVSLLACPLFSKSKFNQKREKIQKEGKADRKDKIKIV